MCDVHTQTHTHLDGSSCLLILFGLCWWDFVFTIATNDHCKASTLCLFLFFTFRLARLCSDTKITSTISESIICTYISYSLVSSGSRLKWLFVNVPRSKIRQDQIAHPTTRRCNCSHHRILLVGTITRLVYACTTNGQQYCVCPLF